MGVLGDLILHIKYTTVAYIVYLLYLHSRYSILIRLGFVCVCMCVCIHSVCREGAEWKGALHLLMS